MQNKPVSLGNVHEDSETLVTKVTKLQPELKLKCTPRTKTNQHKVSRKGTSLVKAGFNSFEMESKDDQDKLEEQEIDSSEDDECSTKSDKRFTARQLIVLALLSFCQFTVGTSGSIQAPFFPFLAEKKGLTSTTYGFVFGIFEIAVIVSSPFYGKIIPITKPRFLIISGIFVVGGCTLLFGLLEMCPAGYPFTILSFAIRAVDGCGCAAFMTACYTMVASQFPNNVAKSFSVLETMFGIGFIAGPTLGGFLYEFGGYKVPFIVMGTMILLGCFLCLVFLPKTKDDVKIQKKGQMLKLLTDFGILLDSAAVMSATLLLGFNSATLEPHLRQFNLTPSRIGFVFIIVGTVYGTTSPIWGFLLNRGVNSKFLCCLGYLFQSICLFLIGPLPILNVDSSIWMIVVALLLGGLGVAIKMISAFTSSLHDSVMRGFPDDMVTHAMVSAIFTSSRSIGGLLGPTVGGALLEHMGYKNGTLTMFTLEILLMCATVSYSLYHHMFKTKKVALIKDPEIQQVQLLVHTRISSEYF